jgi:hypothetical protein
MQQTSGGRLYVEVPVEQTSSMLGAPGDTVLETDKLFDRLRNVGVGQFQDTSKVSVQSVNRPDADGIITLYLSTGEVSADVPRDAVRAILSATANARQADVGRVGVASSGSAGDRKVDVKRGGETLTIARNPSMR